MHKVKLDVPTRDHPPQEDRESRAKWTARKKKPRTRRNNVRSQTDAERTDQLRAVDKPLVGGGRGPRQQATRADRPGRGFLERSPTYESGSGINVQQPREERPGGAKTPSSPASAPGDTLAHPPPRSTTHTKTQGTTCSGNQQHAHPAHRAESNPHGRLRPSTAPCGSPGPHLSSEGTPVTSTTLTFVKLNIGIPT